MEVQKIKQIIAELQAIIDEKETIIVGSDCMNLKDQDPCFTVRFSPNSNTWEKPLTKKMSQELARSIKEQKLMVFATEKAAFEFYYDNPRINEYISASIHVRIYANGTIKFSDGVNYFSKDEFDRIVELTKHLNQ